MEHKDFTFDVVSPLFAICFIDGSPQADTCLRHLADTHIPPVSTLVPPSIPQHWAQFRLLRIMHGAWGFNCIFAEVKQKDNTRLRNDMKKFLGGHGTYYRYHNGSRLLTLEQ